MKNQVIELKGATITLDEGYELLQANGVLTVVEKVNKLPNSWEELGEVGGWCVDSWSNVITYAGKCTESNRNTFRTKEQAEASIALAQLTQLIHVWREGWEPDWFSMNKKWCWRFFKGELQLVPFFREPYFISFDTKEKAQKFLETFEDLIKTAAPLLWGVNLK